MTSRPAPLWAGRGLALTGILLIALNLRTAVAALSPIVSLVSGDLHIDSAGLGLLGALPPIAFAISGVVAPLVARRLGLETTLVLACCAMVVGPVMRAVAPSYAVLLVGGIIVLGGMGFGNILLPPAVKKYFPDRIGQLTAAYSTFMAVSITVPALISAQVAAATSWRVVAGVWAVLAIAALVPWIALKMRAGDPAADAAVIIVARPQPVYTSRTAWAIAIAFVVTALNTYACFAWLPEILRDIAGTNQAQSGALLALYGFTGLPASLIVPVIAGRIRNVGILVVVGVALFVSGYAGLLLAPHFAPWLWVLLAGSGGMLFPLAIVLINLRTRSTASSAALSGFVQGIGYGAAALGPVLVGLLHDATDGWTVPLVFLVGISLVALIPARLLSRPRFVDDELATRSGDQLGPMDEGGGPDEGPITR